MNIAVINIKDLIKYFVFLIILITVIIAGIGFAKNYSFSYCLNTQIPLMAREEEIEKPKEENKLNATYKILDTQLAMLYNINENEEIEEEIIEELQNAEEQKTEEPQDKTINGDEKLETKVIAENNITPSYTNSGNSIQVKNQSSYNPDELIANSSYELTNKDKVIIYHTHTCESFTSSEKFPYEMTGAYRTTDLNYTVARVRR